MLNLCTSPEPALQDIIKQSGYLITPEDFQELLEEAARYLDIPQKNGSLASLENHGKKKHIPWKMNGLCTWKSRCCGKGNHLKQTFMTSGVKPWVWGRLHLAFPFSAINKRHPTAQPTNGSFVGFPCYKKDLMQWQFWRKPPQEIHSFPWGSLSFEWPGIFYFSQWLVVLLIFWLSWSWEFFFQMIYLEKCKPPASLFDC